MKKITALLLALALVSVMILCCACGDDDDGLEKDNISEKENIIVTDTDDIFTYEVMTTGAVCITGFKESSSKPHAITIPEMADERNVIAIADEAFYYCNNITSVTIPACIETIGEYAFAGCSQLTEIVFASSSRLTAVETGAFCKTGIKNITLPDGVTSVGTNAFFDCKKLEAVAFPANLTEIGLGAFYGCISLKSIDLSATDVKIINKMAFYDCEKVTTVSLPASVTEIGAYAFSEMDSLTDEGITAPAGSYAAEWMADASNRNSNQTDVDTNTDITTPTDITPTDN